MVRIPTSSAAEAFSVAGLCIHNATSKAGLRTVLGRNFHKLSTGPCQLVAEHVGEHRPSSVSYAASQPTSNHSSDVEFFNHDRAVAFDKSCRFNVQEVLALTLRLSMQAHHAKLSLLSILRSFLSSRYRTLGSRQALQTLVVVLGVTYQIAIRVREQLRHTTVKGNHWFKSFGWLLNFKFAENRHKPLIAVAPQRARLGLTLKWSMHYRSKRAKFRKAHGIPVKAPSFWRRLGQSQEVLTLALPTWPPRELLETTLPGLVKLDEQLGAHITRHICQPRKLSTQRSELVDLIEGRWILLVRSSQAHSPLLEREVPQEPQGAFPLNDALHLLLCRVDTETKGLADAHRLEHALVCGEVKQLSQRQACSICASGALGLRAKVPQVSNYTTGFRLDSRDLGT